MDTIGFFVVVVVRIGLKRCGKSCRLRWINYLSPTIKHGDFSEEEDDLIIRLHNLLGNRFSSFPICINTPFFFFWKYRMSRARITTLRTLLPTTLFSYMSRSHTLNCKMGLTRMREMSGWRVAGRRVRSIID